VTDFDPLACIAGALRKQTREVLDFLIIVTDRGYYVQFPCPDGAAPEALYCEAVSDEFLEPECQLGDEGASRLRSLGWNEPSSRNNPNWWRNYPLRNEGDFEAIAAELVETLSVVYGYDNTTLDVKVPN
jgi:type III secretion system-like peptide-binding chaperone